jgi:hypothetical protein
MTVRTFRIEKIELMRVGSPRQEALHGQVVGIQQGDQYRACQDGPDVVVGMPLAYKTGREVEKVYDASGPEGKGYRVILSRVNSPLFCNGIGGVLGARFDQIGYHGPVVVTVREVQP